MKKSKVIIPAMALLLFSTAASVTGTVAWFTSTRTFTSDAGNFQVGQLDGNLDCDVTAGIATTASDDNISFNANSILADASYNHTTDHLWTDVPGTDGTLFSDLGTWGDAKWTHGTVNSITYYYAATWTLTFKYEFVAETKNVNLFFDIEQATARITKNGNDDIASSASQPTANTAKGFRIAFVTGAAGSASNGVVWAPYRAQETLDEGDPTEHEAIRYVSDEDTIGDYTGTAAAGDLLDANANTVDALKGSAGTGHLQAPGTTPATTATNYLGTFTKPAVPGIVPLVVRVTAWFEGTDPNIVTNNSTVMQALKVTMPFYVRDAAA